MKTFWIILDCTLIVGDFMMSLLPLLSVRGFASTPFDPIAFRASVKNLCREYDLHFDTIWTDLNGDGVSTMKGRKAFMVNLDKVIDDSL
jgi:hypothetical protein